MATKTALFPGSFDPITMGHYDIIQRGLPVFDKIVVAVGQNASKKYMFSEQQRIDWIRETFKDEPKIEVTSYKGLTVDFCQQIDAHFILRGLRNPADFEFEKAIAQVNRTMMPDLDTVFLLTSPEYAAISSSIVRDVIRNNGDASRFVPKAVAL